MLLFIYLHSQHLRFRQQTSYSGFWKPCRKLLDREGMWTIRKAPLVADNEKQTAGYIHDSSKRNVCCHICLKGLCWAKLSSVFPATSVYDCEKVLLAVNNLKANPFSIGKGRREVHSKILLYLSQVNKHNTVITLCAEVQGSVPLTQAWFGYLLISTSDLNENYNETAH